MIAGVTRHARTQRDARALEAHLMKAENAPRVRVLGGSLATDLPGAVADMQRLRDSTSADAAALHIHLSPNRAMTDNELARAAEIVREHLGAVDHPAVLVFHDKERQAGGGPTHAHLVVGRVSPEGRVLEAGFEKIRLETAARIIEHELGEEPTLGRHHTSAVRWLRNNGRSDIADWLTAAHGPNPDKPTSTASPDKRQALARQGVKLSEARAEIRAAWTSGGAESVQAAGYSIEPGRKSGIFIVSRDGTEIGSLDRLTCEKRADIRNAMEAAQVQISRHESKSGTVQRSRKPAEGDSRPVAGDPSSEKSEKFRPERSGQGRPRDALAGRKKSGAEIASLEIAEQARRFAEGFSARLDDRLAVLAARRWIEDQRASLKGTILETLQAPDDADARREVPRSRRKLAVFDAAANALRMNPDVAFGGERALMGAARRLHAERTAAIRDEIREAWTSGGVTAIRESGFQVAPGRDGAWRVLRDGVPLGTLHRLIGETLAKASQAIESDLRSSSSPDAEKPAKSRQARTSENTQPSEKPTQHDSEVSTGDPSSGKQPRRRSPKDIVAAAQGFFDRLETDLRGQIAELSRPDTLPEPAELADTRRRLSAAARDLAAWEAGHGTRITELRLRTDTGQPTSFWAWVSGATGRYAAAAKELSELFEEREPLLKSVTAYRREINILQAAQETRQAIHNAARKDDLARLRGELSLLPDARAALKADPTIARGGGKALADAARRRQAERRAEERRREPEAVRRQQSASAPRM